MNIDYEKHRGKFLDDKGNVIDAPPPDMPFVVLAAPWEEVKVNRRAMQSKCEVCACFVGLAPPTQDMIAAGRKLIILCRDCFHAFGTI